LYRSALNAQPRVQGVPQPVAEQVEAQHRQHDGQPGEHQGVGSQLDVLTGGG